MQDILIRNCRWPDFEKNRLCAGDIGIRNGKIAAPGDVGEDAALVLDGAGLIASPGFIDIHMHEEDFAGDGRRWDIALRMLRMGVTTCLGGNCGEQHQSLAEFRAELAALGGSPCHYLMLTGYNSLRRQEGLGAYDAASPAQIESICRKAAQELAAGAVGVSYGVEYDPGITEDEVVRSLSLLGRKDLFVSMHYRADSTGALDAIDEMVRIAKRSGVDFQISHLSSCAAMGQMDEALRRINLAMAENPRLDYDTYPYDAFCTHIGSAVFSDGCFESWGKSYDCVLIASGSFSGQLCDEALFRRVRALEPEALAVVFAMNEDEIAAAITNPRGMMASDGILSGGLGHPRAAGAFPRLLGKYVRDEGSLSMMDALRKITLEPARRLRLSAKGRIEPGCDADVTLFDPATICDRATFTESGLPPEGIRAVIVDGTLALRDGELLCGCAGRFVAADERNA